MLLPYKHLLTPAQPKCPLDLNKEIPDLKLTSCLQLEFLSSFSFIVSDRTPAISLYTNPLFPAPPHGNGTKRAAGLNVKKKKKKAHKSFWDTHTDSLSCLVPAHQVSTRKGSFSWNTKTEMHMRWDKSSKKEKKSIVLDVVSHPLHFSTSTAEIEHLPNNTVLWIFLPFINYAFSKWFLKSERLICAPIKQMVPLLVQEQKLKGQQHTHSD